MRTIILWILIILTFWMDGCGTSSLVTLQPEDPVGIEQDPSGASSINLLIDIPLPGFIPRQINLIEEEIASTSLPIFSPNYAVIWTGSVTNGQVLAQSRSDLAIRLEACTLPSGEQSLTARLYNPLDFGLFFPLTEATLPLTVDPGCESLQLDIEVFTLPATSRGDPELLTLRARVQNVDSGDLLAVPIMVELAADGGSLGSSSGTTNLEGTFQTTATLTSGQPFMLVTATVSYQPESGLPLTATTDPLRMERAPSCCRVCTIGKACGNSCINVNFQCHQPPGCACNASDLS